MIQRGILFMRFFAKRDRNKMVNIMLMNMAISPSTTTLLMNGSSSTLPVCDGLILRLISTSRSITEAMKHRLHKKTSLAKMRMVKV